MNDLQEALKDLKDIHLPEPVSFWPLAPGYWILLILIPLLVFGIHQYLKYRSMPKYKKMAQAEFKNIKASYEIHKNSLETISEISLLIRKALVAKIGNKEVAGLVSDEWLDYLDKTSKTQMFTQGAGQYLVTIPYQNELSEDVDMEELLMATRKLLSNL